MKYKRYDWNELINNFQLSGLSQAEFCRQNQLNAKYFSQRLKKYKTPNPMPKSAKKTSPFIQATKVANPIQTLPLIKITIDQANIHASHTDPKWLADFCKALMS